MQTLISLSPSAVAPEELGQILSDYMALDRARIVRRLMVARLGVVALLAVLLETLVRGFSPFVRWLTVGLCLVPPVWVWIVELRRERRLSRRIEAVDRAVAHKFVPRSASHQPSV